jgi:signal recognition particle GTPase
VSVENVFWTRRFLEHFRRYNGINEFVIRKVAELVKKSNAHSKTWHFELEKLKDKSLQGVAAYRFKITTGDRLIVVISDNRIILADIGSHDIMEEYSKLSKKSRDMDLATMQQIEGNFLKQLNLILREDRKNFFKNDDDVILNNLLNEQFDSIDSRWLYEAELSNEWVHFLDAEQFHVAETLLEKLSKPNDKMSIEFIMGGPGTGKTVVLLNLATNLEQMGRAVSFEASDAVLKYLSSGGKKIPGAKLGFASGVVALIDDPASSKVLADSIRRARSAGCRAIVIGFDPLQWHERKMEINFRKIIENTEYQFYPLWRCYRQSSGVGRKSLDFTEKIFHASSRYLDSSKQQKEREELQPYIDLSLGMSFVDNSGRYVVHTSDCEERFVDEISRFRNRIDRWSHTSPIAFVYDDRLPNEFKKSLKAVAIGLNRTEILLSKYQEIRGVEFQELFLFLSEAFWMDLNKGKVGLGTEEWERLTCLHTIFSRPKDCLVIFVI